MSIGLFPCSGCGAQTVDYAHYKCDRCEERERTPTEAAVLPCKAMASRTDANDPQDCNWPVCGCDPHADKVIAALQESGLMVSSSAETYAANMKAAGEKIGRDLTDQARAASKLRRGLPTPSALSGDAGEGE